MPVAPTAFDLSDDRFAGVFGTVRGAGLPPREREPAPSGDLQRDRVARMVWAASDGRSPEGLDDVALSWCSADSRALWARALWARVGAHNAVVRVHLDGTVHPPRGDGAASEQAPAQNATWVQAQALLELDGPLWALCNSACALDAYSRAEAQFRADTPYRNLTTALKGAFRAGVTTRTLARLSGLDERSVAELVSSA